MDTCHTLNSLSFISISLPTKKRKRKNSDEEEESKVGKRITTPAGSLLPPHRSPKLLNPLIITPYPQFNPNDVNPPPSPISGNAATTMPSEFNPYIFPSTVPKNTTDYVKDTLGKWGKMAADATKKAQDLSGNVWQNCQRKAWKSKALGVEESPTATKACSHEYGHLFNYSCPLRILDSALPA